MSLYNSLSVGISSLQAQSNKINSISDNISNATTTGYIGSTQTFAELIASDTASDYSPGGDKSIGALTSYTQGTITTTTSPTDLAITGAGFFPVSQSSPASGDLLYTRAGTFSPDKNGDFVNAQGYFLQGWRLNDDGTLPSDLSTPDLSESTAEAAMQTVNVADIAATAVATTAVSLQANLDSGQTAYSGTPAYNSADPTADMASGTVAPQYDTSITLVDSAGTSHTIKAGFLETSTNTWAVELYADPATDVSGTNPQIAAGTVTFNGDGTLASVSPSLTSAVSVSWQSGASNSGVTFNWGTAGAEFGTVGATVIGRSDGLEQVAGPFNTTNVTQNGLAVSSLTSVSVDSSGDVVGNYADGTSKNLYKIPLATFYNPEQLTNLSDTVYAQSQNSGAAVFSQTGTGGVGEIESEALEGSNVDLNESLSDLIVAQNAYQSSAKLISTSDTMLSDLVSMGAT